MKKILFLTDFSETANSTFIYALSAAQKLKAEIHVLHIVQLMEPLGSDNQIINSSSNHINEMDQEAIDWNGLINKAEELNEMAKQNEDINVRLFFHLEKGKILDTFNSYIAENKIDVALMGTSGVDMTRKKLSHSNTANIIKNSNIPILAIPAQAKFNSVKKFTAAVMLKENERDIIRRLIKNAQFYGYTFSCVHIVESKEKICEAEKKSKRWLDHIGDKDLSLTIVENNNITNGLRKFVQNNNIQILGLLHHNLPFYERLLKINQNKQILQNSNTALLVYNHNSMLFN